MLTTNIKKITILLTVFSQFILWIPSGSAQEEVSGKKQFLVTAYYSPLPDQSFYIRGSYEADVALNGQGTHGADGTAVYVGMLAAPQNYPFGTQINIPGLGVGEVHDRGGAIVSTEGYDRIDVWMGYGEEGLSRALNWGARFVEGEVYFDSSQAGGGFDYSWVNPSLSNATVAQLQANTEKSSSESEADSNQDQESAEVENEKAEPEKPEISYSDQNKNLLAPGFGKGAEGENVKELQRMLQDVGYFQANLTGVYDHSTVEAVFKLQKDQGVLKSEEDLGAGYFGTKTHQALLKALDGKTETSKNTSQEVQQNKPQEVQVWAPPKEALPSLDNLSLPETLPERKELAFQEISAINVSQKELETATQKFDSTLKLDDQGEKVLELQNFLIEKGYLAQGLNTGYFGQKTFQALMDFQIKEKIITSNTNATAGVLDSKTLSFLNKMSK